MNQSKKLKYQYLIDREDLRISCPYEACYPSSGEAYRWAIDPIINDNSFLPNILYWEYSKFPRRMNSEDDLKKCGNCAISLFTTKEKAKKKFSKIPEPSRSNIGYTHIAYGNIDNAGLMSKPGNSGHFELFEFEGSDLKNNFVIVDEL